MTITMHKIRTESDIEELKRIKRGLEQKKLLAPFEEAERYKKKSCEIQEIINEKENKKQFYTGILKAMSKKEGGNNEENNIENSNNNISNSNGLHR